MEEVKIDGLEEFALAGQKLLDELDRRGRERNLSMEEFLLERSVRISVNAAWKFQQR